MINIPAVSIIIPMYNAEKYIAECLESILAQTFQNFEVIIVDDCSTDNGVEIVNDYAPNFGGRLKLYQTKENTGSGAVPRNEGMRFSSGEYIFFIDNDDLITPTALEELHTLAQNYDADVVHCERNYTINNGKLELSTQLGQSDSTETKVYLETENLQERVYKILNAKYSAPQWLNLVRRDFIFKKKIFFLDICPSDDEIWTYALIFLAEKFLCVPNAVYIWRPAKNSIIHKEKTPQQEINFWLNPLVYGLKNLDDLMGKIEFFQQNPIYRCAILENFVHTRFSCIFGASLKMQLSEIYESIRKEFGKNLGEYDVLISFLLADLIEQQKIFVNNRKTIAYLEQKK